jgi:hypothetical protein
MATMAAGCTAAMDTEQGIFSPHRTLEMDTEQGTFHPRRTLEMDAAADELPRGCEIFLHVILCSVVLLASSFFLWLIVEGNMYKEPNYMS